jgi:hypothetical protein
VSSKNETTARGEFNEQSSRVFPPFLGYALAACCVIGNSILCSGESPPSSRKHVKTRVARLWRRSALRERDTFAKINFDERDCPRAKRRRDALRRDGISSRYKFHAGIFRVVKKRRQCAVDNAGIANDDKLFIRHLGEEIIPRRIDANPLARRDSNN